MFGWFKDCIHQWNPSEIYYEHELTQYLNGSDSVCVYKIQKCRACGKEVKETISEDYYPVNNKDSYEEKRKQLKLLRVNGIQSKTDYILKRSKQI